MDWIKKNLCGVHFNVFAARENLIIHPPIFTYRRSGARRQIYYVLCYQQMNNMVSRLTHILQFLLFLSGLLKHYNPSHPDYHSTSMAMVKMQSIIGKMSAKLRDTVSSIYHQLLWKHILPFNARSASDFSTLDCRERLQPIKTQSIVLCLNSSLSNHDILPIW